MRQWGSSLQHNGLSFFPATIPADTQFYHGTVTPEAVTGMEWLAFEIEHAENFARGRGPPPGKGHPRPPTLFHEWFGLGDDNLKDAEPDSHGYLHEYRTIHDLRVLYIDGMAAAKSTMGTLDLQDFILRNFTDPQDVRGDWQRAKDLCTLGVDWNIEGFIRMEPGFELILCNFSDAVEFVAATQRPKPSGPEVPQELDQFE